jgi:hypothetical protein
MYIISCQTYVALILICLLQGHIKYIVRSVKKSADEASRWKKVDGSANGIKVPIAITAQVDQRNSGLAESTDEYHTILKTFRNNLNNLLNSEQIMIIDEYQISWMLTDIVMSIERKKKIVGGDGCHIPHLHLIVIIDFQNKNVKPAFDACCWLMATEFEKAGGSITAMNFFETPVSSPML